MTPLSSLFAPGALPKPDRPLRCFARAWLALLLVAAAAEAQESRASIRVRLATTPEGGQLRLLLFDSPSEFGRFSSPALVERFAPDARDGFIMADVPPGVYALVVHHDENANGELDKNFIGIPTEPIAISNGYRPKGPPAFARAQFTLAPNEERVFELTPYRVLGPRGLFGIGIGVIGRSSPYVGSDGGVFQPIPAITFNGERLQWFGPSLRFGLAGSDRLRLAATARYRLPPYEQNDSPVLAGLGDRKATLLAGLALIGELEAGFGVSAGYEHDVLDQIGGGAVRLGINRSFQSGVVRLTPKLGLNWSSEALANHDFGVPRSGAAPGRPAYDVGDYWSVELGFSSFIELARNWRIVVDVGVELLPDEVRSSPIVGEDQVIAGFFALAYSF